MEKAVKQRPLQSVSLTFGLAFGMGLYSAGSLQEFTKKQLVAET
jgi:hypothetical protein